MNPALEAYRDRTPISVAARDCAFHVFVTPFTRYSDCDRARDFLTKQGLSFKVADLPAGAAESVILRIGDDELKGWNEKRTVEVLKAGGYPQGHADSSRINKPMTVMILVVMMLYVTLVYGPIAAFLVELFPTQIRYTSMSLPYHIGNGWFGGMLPLLATAMAAASGDIYFGLWYPIIVAVMTFVVGLFFLRDNRERDIESDWK